jgi:dihydropteroate synthase
MGILNVTPDSFFDGGRLHDAAGLNLDMVYQKVEKMIVDGADIIDVGGESTRPGAVEVSLQQEIDRVLPVVEGVAARFDTVISVDTSSPELMLKAASCGAGLINDIRALERPGAIAAAVSTGLPVCLMHMQGQPQSMQNQPIYKDIFSDVCDYLLARLELCVAAGLDRSKLILDPGFGFGKTVDHNFQLLGSLPDLVALGYPVLVGLSRKSLLGQVLGRPEGQRLAGSIALALLAVERGATIIRVHDVAETVDAVKLSSALKNSIVNKQS